MVNNFNKPLKNFKEKELHKSAGILDDFAVRKNVATREGTIEKVPVDDNDIVNKSYCDANPNYLLNTGDTATGDYNFDSNTLFIDSVNNRVGIGTSSPNVSLDINGSIGIANRLYMVGDSSPGFFMDEGLTNKAYFMFDEGFFQIQRRNGGSIGSIGTYGATIFRMSLEAPSDTFYIVSSGRVGINTNAPDKQMEINSVNGNNLRLTYNDGTGGATYYSDFLMSSSGDLNIAPVRNVGIGTTSPDDKLDVEGSGNLGIRITNTGNTSSDYSALRFYQDGTEKGVIYTNQENLFINPSDTNDLILQTRSGNVGIGDTAPAEKLDVTGNINCTGVLKIDDVQILKEQQAHIADAKADYTTGDLDTEAEIITAINATNAKINSILAMLETHGLVASS